MNKFLELDFKKADDYKIVLKETEQYFSLFTYSLEDQEEFYYLLANRSDNGYLVPEKKAIDYFLIVEGLMEENDKKVLVENIKKLNGVLSAIVIDAKGLRSKQNLLME